MFLFDNMDNSYWKLLLMGKSVIHAEKWQELLKTAALITTYSS